MAPFCCSGIVIYPASDQNLVLGTARTAQLEAYQRATGARVVRFGTASDFFGEHLKGGQRSD